MAPRQRTTTSPSAGLTSGAIQKGKRTEVKRGKDRNETRREVYNSDPEYRSRVKSCARASYRRLRHGKEEVDNPYADEKLKGKGTVRILYDVEGTETDYYTQESFTISETAQALGRTRLTIRKWVQEGIIPEATFRDSVYMYHNYTSKELVAIVKALKPHFDDFSYVKSMHVGTIARVHAAVDAARHTIRLEGK